MDAEPYDRDTSPVASLEFFMGPRHLLCTQCGAETSSPVLTPPGSPWVAVVLAVPFVLPAVVYTVWRYAMRRPVCPTCGHAQLIPADAPLARAWRSAGWIAGRPAATNAPAPAAQPITAPDIRLDRIEQAIDAIAGEVDRIAATQRTAALRGDRDHPPLLRERGAITPT